MPHILESMKTAQDKTPQASLELWPFPMRCSCDREGEKGNGKGLTYMAWQGNEIVIICGFRWLFADLLDFLSTFDER